MSTLAHVTVQPSPSPAPTERSPSGFTVALAIVGVAIILYGLTKVINSMFGGGSGKPDRADGWR